MKRILNVASGKSTYGTDFIDCIQSRSEIIKQDLNKNPTLPYKDNTFDEVVCIAFIQCSINVGLLISEMRRVLKKGCKLKILTDNSNYWMFAYRNSCHRIKRNDYLLYSLFTDRHLYNLAKFYELENIKIKYTYLTERSKSFLRKWFKTIITNILISTPLRIYGYKNVCMECVK